MANPWDRLPFPKSGDDGEETLFVWLGAAINQWERVEFNLSRTYSLLSGDADWGKCKDYGQGRIFRERKSDLERVARSYFTSYPNQHLEGDFDCLMDKAEGFADRRNEFAHSIAMNVESIEHFREQMPDADMNKPNVLLIPPLYHIRKHSTGFPDYAFSSVELIYYGQGMLALEDEITTFNKRLMKP